MSALHEISQKLAIWSDPYTGKPTRGATEQDLYDLKREASDMFWASDLGQEIRERGGDDAIDRFLDAYADRYGDASPASVPFVESLIEVGTDLLVDLPHLPPAPPRELTKRAAPATPPPPKISNEAHDLAYLIKKQILRDGVSSLKARSGIVTVKAETGQSYQYESSLFETLYEEAVLCGELPPIGGAR